MQLLFDGTGAALGLRKVNGHGLCDA